MIILGNLTIKYTNNTTEINDKYTFWGATNCNGDLYGLYYISNNLNMYYEAINISTNCKCNNGPFFTKDIIFEEGKIYEYDYTGVNTSTTTDANNIWKSKVTNKIIEEKDVVNTYTFLDNGDIKVETRDNKTYTLNFWGATNYYNDLLGIYYIKIDLKDIFGIIAPNESTYFYYGYVLEYEGRFPKAIERGQDSFYITNSINWYEKNFDINGKPKGTIDWGNMLIQESRYTSPITTKDIILFKK